MPEKRLIDANALIEQLKKDWPQTSRIKWAQVVASCAPTIDAVEVVRCKDCFLEDCKAKEFYGENGFCSIGERK